MRDIHVIYADSNSADFAGFKNRLLLKWSQCKHSKKGTVRRDWNDVDNRNRRDVLEKRQRRETEGAVFETRGTGKEDGLDVLRDASALAQLERVCTCIIIRIRTYIRELAHARPPMSSISLVYVGACVNLLSHRLVLTYTSALSRESARGTRYFSLRVAEKYTEYC